MRLAIALVAVPVAILAAKPVLAENPADLETAMRDRTAAQKDAQWNKLIDEAKKHGGVETVLDKFASYVFAGPDGLTVTFTRTLDNKTRAVCAIYEDRNVDVCLGWNSGKLAYGTRADANSPWVMSFEPPKQPEQSTSTPVWVDLLSTLFGAGISPADFRYGRHPSFLSHHLFRGLHRR